MNDCYVLWRYINGAITFKTDHGRPSGNLNKAIRFDDVEEAYSVAQQEHYTGISQWKVGEDGYPLVMRYIPITPVAVAH